MKIIGLTGGIASGKTTVSRQLARLGAHVVDADVIAREVLEIDQPAYKQLVETFGQGILQSDGRINRRQLGEQVFKDAEAIHILNRITHPPILRIIQERVESLRSLGEQVIVISAALLMEAGMCEMVDEVWVVAADRSLQMARLKQRDGYSETEAEARLAAQLPLADKLRRADRVIDNNGSLEETQQQLEKLWRELTRGGGEGEANS